MAPKYSSMLLTNAGVRFGSVTGVSDDLVAALAGAAATLIAAGVTAVVGAALFVVGELLKLHREKVERQTATVARLLTAWEDVARVSAPRSGKWWSVFRVYPERVDISAGWALLPVVLPRRDFELITLQRVLNDELVKAPTDRQRIAAAAEATGVLVIWLANRRRGRQFARSNLARRGVKKNFDGSAVRNAAEPKRAF